MSTPFRHLMSLTAESNALLRRGLRDRRADIENDAWLIAEVAGLMRNEGRKDEWLDHSVEMSRHYIDVARAAAQHDFLSAVRSHARGEQMCKGCHDRRAAGGLPVAPPAVKPKADGKEKRNP
jgi:hypothetical protein